MKKIWILLVIALVVLFVGFREGLEATDKIKAPNPSGAAYSDEETRRALNLLAQAEREAFIRSFNLPISATAQQRYERIRGSVRTILRDFYNTKYRPATSQLTHNDVDRHVDTTMTSQTPAYKEFARKLLKAYFVDQVSTPYGDILTEMGQSTGPAPTPTGQSVLARKRPGIGDDRLRGEVAAYTGLPRDNPMINTIINEMGRFYDRVYVRNGKRMPTQAEIQTFVMSSTAVPPNRKSNLTSAIDYWFTEPAIGSDFRLEGSPATPPQVPGTTVDGGSSTSRGFSRGIANNQIWGPPFSGFGRLRGSGSSEGDGSGRYPTLMGPPRERAPYMVGVGVLPPGPSSTPGDRDLIPDPYRVSQSYSPASNSSKNEPVPFLTDFSAFLN